MFKKLFFVGLSLLVLSRESLGVEKGNVNSAHHGKVGLIDEVIHHVFTGSGDHSTRLQTDDEDLVDVGSGQGSGSGDRDRTETTTPRLTTKVTTLTPCEQLRRSAQNVSSDNYPKCTSSGEFERVQCHMNRKECWCVDRMGREITGSRMSQPKIPDCITGTGLKSCVFELLRSKYSLLGKFEPQCTFSGDYEKIQCFESGCWCVDEEGIQQRNTKVYKPAIPTCPEPTSSLPPTPVPDTDAPVTIKPIFPNHHDHRKKDKGKKTTEKPFISIDDTDDDDNDKNVDESIKPLDKVTPEEKAPYDVNTNNEGNIEINKPEGLGQSKSPIVHIMTQPGLLAAVIGGAVVGLLCAILLVMFIVYRMRKKDEGSYPLEEQKYTNYSYMKAPDKEFYA